MCTGFFTGKVKNGPVVGYRIFKVSKNGWLQPIVIPSSRVWHFMPAKVPMKSLQQGLGLHGFRTRKQLRESYPLGRCVAKCVFFGRVELDTAGLRASHAYIIRVNIGPDVVFDGISSKEILRRLRRNYPHVQFVTWDSELRAP